RSGRRSSRACSTRSSTSAVSAPSSTRRSRAETSATRSSPSAGPEPLLPPVDRALQLRLAHPRAALDAEAARLVVELLFRAPLRPICPGAEPAAAARRHVGPREPRARARLTLARALLVDSAGRDLLRARLRPALLALAVLDALVLAGELRTLLHSAWRHLDLL